MYDNGQNDKVSAILRVANLKPSLGQLADCVRLLYPDGGFVDNYGNAEIGDDETHLIEDMLGDFRCCDLNWCCCGMPEESYRAILEYFETLDYSTYDYRSHKWYKEDAEKQLKDVFGGYGDVLLLCLMYEMDAHGFTEHGSSVYGAWLTDKGCVFRALLRKYFESQQEGKSDA